MPGAPRARSSAIPLAYRLAQRNSLLSNSTTQRLGNRGGGQRWEVAPSPTGTKPRFRAPRRSTRSAVVTAPVRRGAPRPRAHAVSTSCAHVDARNDANACATRTTTQPLAHTWAQGSVNATRRRNPHTSGHARQRGRSRKSLRTETASARHRPTRPHSARHRPTPSCPRDGFAGAWGHPRAQAEGRARGPYFAAPAWGHHILGPRQISTY